MKTWNTISIILCFGMLFYHGAVNKVGYAIVDAGCLLFFVVNAAAQAIIEEIKKK